MDTQNRKVICKHCYQLDFPLFSTRHLMTLYVKHLNSLQCMKTFVYLKTYLLVKVYLQQVFPEVQD